LTRLLAISGSLRKASINTAVLEALSLLAPLGVEIALYRDLDALPYFNADRDNEAPPATVTDLRAQVGASDGLIIAAPEYAHGLPGLLKNALDWLVASEAFPAKPVMLVNTAPRAFHAQTSLRETLMTMSARLIPEAFATLPLTGKPWLPASIAADPQLAAPLRAALASFVAAIKGDASASPGL
jgi:chromate reductase, NAD(P)H dehydrogenase (quinone)